MRMCMDRLPKNEMHGQKPVVTLPTKNALAQFESQQKTRPIPPPTNAPRGPAPMQGGPMQGNNNFPPNQPQNHPPRMMMPNGPPGFRPQHMPQNMGPMPPNQCPPPRMQVANTFYCFQFLQKKNHIFFFFLYILYVKQSLENCHLNDKQAAQCNLFLIQSKGQLVNCYMV